MACPLPGHGPGGRPPLVADRSHHTAQNSPRPKHQLCLWHGIKNIPCRFMSLINKLMINPQLPASKPILRGAHWLCWWESASPTSGSPDGGERNRTLLSSNSYSLGNPKCIGRFMPLPVNASPRSLYRSHSCTLPAGKCLGGYIPNLGCPATMTDRCRLQKANSPFLCSPIGTAGERRLELDF